MTKNPYKTTQDHYYTSYNVYHAYCISPSFPAALIVLPAPGCRAAIGASGFLQKITGALKPFFPRCISHLQQFRTAAQRPDPFLIIPRSSSLVPHESQKLRSGVLRSVRAKLVNVLPVDNLILSRVLLLPGRKIEQSKTLGASLFDDYRSFIRFSTLPLFESIHTKKINLNSEYRSHIKNYSKFTIPAYSISPASLRAGIVPLFKAGGVKGLAA